MNNCFNIVTLSAGSYMLTYNFCAGFFFVVTFLIQHVGNFYIDVEYLLSTSTASRKKKQNLFYK